MRQKMTDETPFAEQDLQPETDSADMFPREYVEELRSEAKSNRERATEATAALERIQGAYRALAVSQAVSGVLADATDLPWSDDFLDENGLVDSEAVKAAAEELAAAKPHLARARGDAMQGFRADEKPFDLAELMRS